MPANRKLGKTTDQRMAMLRQQVTDFLDKGRMETTVTRAKEIAPLAEKMISLGKEGGLNNYREALAFITREDIAKRTFNELATRYKDRTGGYTRITRIGQRRGDAAELGGESKSVTQMSRTLGNRLVRYPVGGVVIFGKNIVSPHQLETFLADLQRASKTPLLTAVDEEGGKVSRLAAESAFGLPRYPSAMAVGREGEAAAEGMGRAIGAYLRRYGFVMDFAPVADVATNPENPVIGERAFSSDAGRAAALSGAMAEGLRAEGIIPVYKHFPGHGDTAEDSHALTAVSGKTAEELRVCEWLPYLRNDLRGCAVMVGHIALPSVTGDMTPASLSETIVSGLLRGELGFDGPVITDSLSMESVRERDEPGGTALAALRAGCDMLLMPADLPAAYEAVLSAVESGEISESRLDESVRRILRCKASAGLI